MSLSLILEQALVVFGVAVSFYGLILASEDLAHARLNNDTSIRSVAIMHLRREIFRGVRQWIILIAVMMTIHRPEEGDSHFLIHVLLAVSALISVESLIDVWNRHVLVTRASDAS